jgi:hypothetical protein
MPDSKPSLRELLLVPTLITLAVTLLRLAGELLRWSPSLFNREAGGGGALVGIVWLIPIFGILFALRLDAAGEGPPGIGKALGWAVLAFAFNMAVFAAAIALFPKLPVAQLAVFGVGSWVAIALARPGWPSLWRVLLAYGLAARIPVVVVMFLAIFLGWDSHYAKPRPDFPSMGPWGLFLWTGLLPQLSIWIYLTVVGGILFGALAVLLRRRVRGGGEARVSSAA